MNYHNPPRDCDPSIWYGDGKWDASMGQPPQYSHPDYLKGYCDQIQAIAKHPEERIDWITRLADRYCGDGAYEADF